MPTSSQTLAAPQPPATGSTDTYSPAACVSGTTPHEQQICVHAPPNTNSNSASAQPADSDSGCSANHMASAFAHALASAFGLALWELALSSHIPFTVHWRVTVRLP